MTDDAPWMWLIGGPNGAGKTTLAYRVVGSILPNVFVNADEIAKGLSPRHPEAVAMQAGRLLLSRLETLTAARSSFVLETTMSSRNYLRLAARLQGEGWGVGLFYVWLNSADLAVGRVATRVREGGHFVPPEDIRRRYTRSMENLRPYVETMDRVILYDNSTRPRAVGEFVKGRQVARAPSRLWEVLER
jgi:predicted ABC-type ATPase